MFKDWLFGYEFTRQMIMVAKSKKIILNGLHRTNLDFIFKFQRIWFLFVYMYKS